MASHSSGNSSGDQASQAIKHLELKELKHLQSIAKQPGVISMLSSEISKVSSEVAWMERLAFRKAKKQVILQAIRRTSELSCTTIAAGAMATKEATSSDKGNPLKTYATALSENVNGRRASSNPEKVITPNNQACTAQTEDEGGWTLVTRRQRSKHLQVNTKLNATFDPHHANLLSQGRCFKCLEKGHKRYQCKALRRCFRCQATDHIAKHCFKPLPAKNSGAWGHIAAPRGQPNFRADLNNGNQGPLNNSNNLNEQQQQQIRGHLSVAPAPVHIPEALNQQGGQAGEINRDCPIQSWTHKPAQKEGSILVTTGGMHIEGSKSMHNGSMGLVPKADELIQVLLPQGNVLLHARGNVANGMVQPIQKIHLGSFPNKILIEGNIAALGNCIEIARSKGLQATVFMQDAFMKRLFEFFQSQNNFWAVQDNISVAQNEIIFSPNEKSLIHETKKVIAGSDTIEEMINEDGSPPGYPGPPIFKQVTDSNSCLSLEESGGYQNPEEGAKMKNKPSNVGVEMIETPDFEGEGHGILNVTPQGLTQADPNKAMITDSELGPPPGFLGPPRYTFAPIRRSPRLSAKNNGVYISPQERARMVTKPDTVSAASPIRKKKIKKTPVQLDYMKSVGPLTHSQAEVVVFAAGVDMSDTMAAKVKGVLAI